MGYANDIHMFFPQSMMIDICHELLIALLLQFFDPKCKKNVLWWRLSITLIFAYFFLIFFKLSLEELMYCSLKQSKNERIIYPQNNELLVDNIETIIDLQLNCYINIVEVMREHELKMMAIWCAIFSDSNTNTLYVFKHNSGSIWATELVLSSNKTSSNAL